MDQPRQDRAAPARVVVRTGSRLHFGPFSVSGDGGTFGGVGMMIAEPGFEVTLVRSRADQFEGPGEYRKRVEELLARLRSSGPGTAKTGDDIRLGRVIPRHAGLGSGTQLALALAAAIGRLEGREQGEAEVLARLLGRGRRSAIGVHGFRLGGFLVDAGKQGAEVLGRLEQRVDFPEDWPILLWTPRDGTGLSGDSESSAFQELSAMSRETTAFLKVTANEMRAAIERRNPTAFSSALWEYGTAVGEFFAPAQGGVFSHSRAAEVVDWLRARGVSGVGQSSWGPTLAAVLPSDTEAAQAIADWPFERKELIKTRALNQGATIFTE